MAVSISYVYKGSEKVNENNKAADVSKDYVFTNDQIQQALSKDNSTVKVDAIVKSFSYDLSSGTKFLEFDAIIYKDTKTQYITVGETYTFYGHTQKYNNIYELRIETVK